MSDPKPWEQGYIDREFDKARNGGLATAFQKIATAPGDPMVVEKTKRKGPSINVRQKGAKGERDLATDLNGIVNSVYQAAGYPLPDKPIIQRNQNQTAVGGKDLVGTFGLAIEVKRQENLSVNTWWRQCEASADALHEFPVLIYRQNGKAWRVVLYLWGQLPQAKFSNPAAIKMRAEIDYESFKSWFRSWVRVRVDDGVLS